MDVSPSAQFWQATAVEAEWPTFPVEELQRRGWLFVEDGNHGESRPLPHEFGSGSTAFIRAADIDYGRVLFETAECINDTALARIRKGVGRGGDVLFSHKGTVGKLALVPLDAPPFVCSPQTTFWRTLDPTRLDRQFLFSFMRSKPFADQWFSRKGETDMADYVSLTAQRGCSVPVPPIEQQHAIGRVLGALDDKIELNRQMNRTLEAMAQAIFRSWFVDCDPVAAKTAGRQPFGMDSEIAGLFPDRVRDSHMGPLPDGWIPTTIAGIAGYVNGRNFTAGATGRGRMVIRIAELNSGPGPSTVYTEADAPPAHIAQPGDLLFAWSGSLGIYRWWRDDALINQHVFKVVCERLPQWFVHWHLREALPFFQSIAAEKATTMGHIKREHLAQWDLAIPSRGLLQAADRILGPRYNRIFENERESLVLADLGVLLLAGLLSGEIRLREAEKLVEQAGA